MKHLILLLPALILLAACQKPATADHPEHAEETPLAHYKEGRGVILPEPMQKSLGLQIADVAEQKITPHLRIPLHVRRGGEGSSELEGWLTSEQAANIKPGAPLRITLADGKTATGSVQTVEKGSFSALGDFEITARIAATLENGTPVTATVDLPTRENIVAVPPSAVLKTAEGEYVYTANDGYFARTPIKTGLHSEEFVEIHDGLYAGDQIVVAQVTPLWLTELQTIRAGQSCCKGH